MNTNPGPRVRFLAVLSLIIVVGIGAYVLINGSSSTSSTAGTQTALSKTQTTTKTTAPKTKSTKPEKRNKSKRTTSAVGVNALDAALISHPLVIVSVYAPNVITDAQAMKEARAGAARAGAGFVAFNIFNEKIARQLGDLIGDKEMTNPEVLFFKRGRTLVFTLHGFADSQVVAQAARNVYPNTEPWVGVANRICGRFSARLDVALTTAKRADPKTAAGRKQAAAALESAATLVDTETTSLSGVRANVSAAKNLAQLVTDLQQIATNWRSEAAAVRRNDLSGAQTIDQTNAKLGESTGNLAANLQLTTCVS